MAEPIFGLGRWKEMFSAYDTTLTVGVRDVSSLTQPESKPEIRSLEDVVAISDKAREALDTNGKVDGSKLSNSGGAPAADGTDPEKIQEQIKELEQKIKELEQRLAALKAQPGEEKSMEEQTIEQQLQQYKAQLAQLQSQLMMSTES